VAKVAVLMQPSDLAAIAYSRVQWIGAVEEKLAVKSESVAKNELVEKRELAVKWRLEVKQED
jgi:hypothetical protein